MNFYICQSYPKFVCKCTSPNLFFCAQHSIQHLSEPGVHQICTIKNIDLFPILLKDLKKLKFKIQASCYQEIKKLLEKLNSSFKTIDNCIKNFEKKFDMELISEISLLKELYEIKTLKFFDFEGSDFENKYFCKILQEEDGIYTGTIRLEQDDIFIKEGKGNEVYKDGGVFEGE